MMCVPGQDVCLHFGKEEIFFPAIRRYDSGGCDDMQRMQRHQCKKEPAEDEGILEKADRLVSEKISVIHVGVCQKKRRKKKPHILEKILKKKKKKQKEGKKRNNREDSIEIEEEERKKSEKQKKKKKPHFFRKTQKKEKKK